MCADFDTSRPCVTLCEIFDDPSVDGIYPADCLGEAIPDADDDFRSLPANLADVPHTVVRNDESAPNRAEYDLWVRMLDGRYADTDRLAEVA